ncbi:hypothetical protein DFH28DRAFT_1222997 [Melampsora americana]|nr:hypothetical protein DFH28DRAFT_1222997 [Melampsora americana]
MSGQIHISTSAKTYITDRHRQRVHPLPPPIIGHLTGLTCPDCPLNSTRQLRYHPPRFPNPENINWKCHEPDSNHVHGKPYVRTLKLEHLINNIRAVNAGAQPPPPPGSLSGLLNISNEAPDHLKKNSTGQLCPGYLGKTGATHHSSIKSNMKCSNKLCLSCCQMGQRVHSLACNFKAHLYTPPSSGFHPLSSPSIRDHRLSSPPIGSFIPFGQPSGSNQGFSQIQSAQANRAVTSTLTPSQLAEYHENIKAVDLVNKGREYAKREAARTIWIELWTKPGSSTLINAEAPNWPLFSLQESQIVIDKCRKGMSDTEDWESEIQVWNMEQFRWVSLAPTCTLKYPLIPRKILVRLESTSDSDCSGLSDAILKMTTEGPYEPLNTPARCILTKSPNPPTFKPSNSKSISPAVPCVNGTTTQTSAEFETPNSPPLPSPRMIYSKPAEIKWIGSSMEPKGGADSPKLQPKMQNQSYKSTWPDSRVLLRQTLIWHKSIQGHSSLWDAWNNFFGETYDYGHTTVYRVKSWISLVGEENLQIDVRATPSLTLIAARKKYHTEWLATRACNNKDRPKQKRRGQKVQDAQEPKRRKVDGVDNTRSDAQSDPQSNSDSDVQIVNH